MMGAMGPGAVNAGTLLGMLSTAPILNDRTVYTATMSPALDTYYTLVRA
jgi:hypothetical protein